MRWKELYRSRLVNAESCLDKLKDGNTAYVSGNGATPFALLRALSERIPHVRDVELVHVLELGADPFAPLDLRCCCRHRSLFVGPADRESVNAGHSHYIPISLHEIPKLFELGRPNLDAALVHVSPPDDHGYVSLGAEVIATKAALRTSPVKIAQVNAQMPRALGDCFVHVSEFDALLEVDEALPELARPVLTDVERQIGQNVASLVEDGSTLQLGIGAIPDAVLAALEGKRHLGIHTEMVSDGVMEAIESGIVTGAVKSLHPGKVVATFALGTQALYEFIDDNPIFEFRPCDYTNDPFVVAKNDRMVAINSAIEIDITGQVCADSIGTRIYSGVGGQLDFIRGAARSRGGKPIIAIPATAQGGRISRIVPTLKPGAGVVTTRADVHYVVTEYGVADLYGRSLQERAAALISIAAPKFRDELRDAARQRHLVR